MRSKLAYLEGPLATTTSVDTLRASHTFVFQLPMQRQRQRHSTEDWIEVNHLFDRVAHQSRESRRGTEEDRNFDGPESDREVEDLDAILVDTIEAIAKMDPQKAQRIAESSAGSLLSPPPAGSSANAVLGGSSVFSQTPGPQGHNLSVQPNPRQCSSCGTTTTPEWRRGPKGLATLCNGCGLVWQKIKKRREQGEEDDNEEEDEDGNEEDGDKEKDENDNTQS